MRDLLIFALIFGLIPFILKRPVIGVLTYAWIGLMNPHRLTYGAAYDFPFAALIAGVTFVAIFFSKEPKRLPITPVTGVLLVFMFWVTFTSFFALEPERAWTEWSRVMKTLGMTLLTMYVIQREKDIKLFTWVLGLSLGFYGLKGGIFSITHGGVNRVFGPEKSYIYDNNHLALALLVALPLLWYLATHESRKWLRIALIILASLTMLSIVATYSRGAFLGGIAMLGFLWLKSRHKLTTALAVGLSIPLILSFMPGEWFERMNTISAYQEDGSALGRINAWGYAINLAGQHIFGGGFDVFTPRLFLIYAPEPLQFHAAHSIYFQVLGEHGYIGLGLFLLLMLMAWRTGTQVIRHCKNREELKWARELAAMAQVSIIGYAVGGAFLSLAYYDLYYYVIALLVVLQKVLLHGLESNSKVQMTRVNEDEVLSESSRPKDSNDKVPV